MNDARKKQAPTSQVITELDRAQRPVHDTYGAADSIADKLSRLDAVKDDDGGSPGDTLSAYSYNGAGRMVVEDFQQPDVRLDYWGQTADTYAGFDRFGRVTQQLWRAYTASADREKFAYGYDRNSNRTWKENVPVGGRDEYYTYDNLNRLTAYSRGNLTGSPYSGTVSDNRREAWTLSPVGNWTEYKVDAMADDDYTDAEDLNQTRSHNLVNEIGTIGEGGNQMPWADPGYDARGNMTTVPAPASMTETYTATYDSWNRLVEVKLNQTTLGKYEYDGLTRRIKSHIDSQAPNSPNGVDAYRHFYYNSGWQTLETRKSNSENTEPETLNPEYQYVWSARYIDAPTLRDENKNADGDCTDAGTDQRLYYLTDANMNVTCLVGTDGAAVERYLYDPYGGFTVYTGAWGWRNAPAYDNSLLFCGYYRDNETGLYHVRNRYYHTMLGTWITRDPAGYADGMGLYQYARSNALLYLDPSGKTCPRKGQGRNCKITGVIRTSAGMRPKTVKAATQAAKNLQTIDKLATAAGGAANLSQGAAEQLVWLADTAAGAAMPGADPEAIRDRVSKYISNSDLRMQGYDIQVLLSYELCDERPCWIFWTKLEWTTDNNYYVCDKFFDEQYQGILHMWLDPTVQMSVGDLVAGVEACRQAAVEFYCGPNSGAPGGRGVDKRPGE